MFEKDATSTKIPMQFGKYFYPQNETPRLWTTKSSSKQAELGTWTSLTTSPTSATCITWTTWNSITRTANN